VLLYKWRSVIYDYDDDDDDDDGLMNSLTKERWKAFKLSRHPHALTRRPFVAMSLCASSLFK
jgi:hypothetical protein